MDTEMIDMNQQHHGNQNEDTSFATETDSDDEDGASDDGERGLLTRNSERTYRREGPPGKSWLQVKNIVIEVR